MNNYKQIDDVFINKFKVLEDFVTQVSMKDNDEHSNEN